MKKKKTIQTLALTTILAALAAIPAHAAILAYDGFDYTAGLQWSSPTGSIVTTTLNGGSGFTTNWQFAGRGSVTTTADGIIGTPFPSTADPVGTDVNFRRSFDALTDAGTYYFKFTLDNTNDSAGSVRFYLNYGDTSRIYVGQAANQSIWDLIGFSSAITDKTGPSPGLPSRPDERPTLFVLKLEVSVNGITDRPTALSLYINPDLSSTEPLTPYITANTNLMQGINQIRVLSAYNSGNSSYASLTDEFVLTTQWSDIMKPIPEPGSVLLFLGGVALVFARRRRS